MISDLLASKDVVWFFIGVALTGWNLYASSAKKELKDGIKAEHDRNKELKLKHEVLEAKIAAVERDYLTRNDLREFRAEVLAMIDKMSLSLTGAIDKMAVRLDKRKR